MQPEIRVVDDLPALYRTGADEFERCARDAISAHGGFAVALSGGSTPKGVYSLLAADQSNTSKRLQWEKIHIFFGDERHVPPTDRESNFRMANETVISKVPIPPENVHRVATELDAREAASQYEQELRKVFQPASTPWPRFDLIMLGMGPDGHTASLFPNSEALNEDSRWVVANWVEKFNSYRITFTLPVINNAARIMFLVAGEDKAEVLKKVLRPEAGDSYPSQRIQPIHGSVIWIVDQGAAKLL